MTTESADLPEEKKTAEFPKLDLVDETRAATSISELRDFVATAKMSGVKEVTATPQVLAQLIRKTEAPPEGYIMYDGITVWVEGKKEEAQARDARDINQITFGRSNLIIGDHGRMVRK